MTETEAEELAVRKRRAEGSPCTQANFLAWKEKFEAEMVEIRKEEEAAAVEDRKKKKEKIVDKSNRLTGSDQFRGKVGSLNYEAMEEAFENALRDEDEEEEEDLDVDEELFDVDDEDLDDLDFDDEDDEEEEPDI